MKSNHETQRWNWEFRRWLAFVASVIFLGGSGVAHWYGSGNNASFSSGMLFRVGILLFALFLAWPSLKRPAQWLPAGAAVIGVAALMFIAAQPKLAVPAIAGAGILITASGIARAFRGPKK